MLRQSCAHTLFAPRLPSLPWAKPKGPSRRSIPPQSRLCFHLPTGSTNISRPPRTAPRTAWSPDSRAGS